HTPGGSEEWVKRVELQFIPTIGQVFSSLEEGIEFYRIYALACGFTPRKYTMKTHRGGVFKNQIVVCNRQGFRENRQRVIPITDGNGVIDNNSGIDSIKSARRRVKITRIGCQAHIRFASQDNVIVVDQFHERHNHRLSSVHDRDLQKLSRSLSLFHKQLIVDHSKLNIGPSKSFTICKEYVNGYSNVGASLIEFKNFQRDIKCYIGERDAQLFIDRYKKPSETKKGFYFAYHVDASMTLCRVFWADAEAIRNYYCFGDAISFDPTYGTNKYCMVFTPFTGHIMGKVTDKVGSSICRDTDFLSRLNSIVWDSDLELFEFEEKWTELMNDFEIADHSWFSAMFAIRKNWIPAFHRDLPMGCILRTNQRSESANLFFKRYENHFGTLVEFWMRFQTAVDQQRYLQKCDDNDSAHSLPVTVTPLHLEAHAASTGKTFKVFYNISTTAATCTCKLFERKGLLCRHILWVYSGKGVRSISKRYILSRLTKDELNSDKNVVDDHDFVNSNQTNLSKVWSEFHETVSLLKIVPDVHVEELGRLLVEFREKICPQAEPLTKDQEMEMLLGCSASSDITILPPTKSNNKGSGKRLRSTKAQCIEKAEKPKRLCAYCKEIGSHDKRNCAVRIADEAAAKEGNKNVRK
ncbi:hypothetical protein RND81_04G069600, partial [Saponaria officinalis]